MKKIRLIAVIAVALFGTATAFGQNIQMHYDFGRNCATTTVEMFRPDELVAPSSL